MEARGKRAAFSEVRWARSVRPRRRQLPQGPSVCDKIAASSDCSRPVNDYVHIEAADLCRPNARFTTERQGYQVLTPFWKLGYSQKVYLDFLAEDGSGVPIRLKTEEMLAAKLRALTFSSYCPRTRSTPSDGLILRWTLAGSRRS